MSAQQKGNDRWPGRAEGIGSGGAGDQVTTPVESHGHSTRMNLCKPRLNSGEIRSSGHCRGIAPDNLRPFGMEFPKRMPRPGLGWGQVNKSLTACRDIPQRPQRKFRQFKTFLTLIPTFPSAIRCRLMSRDRWGQRGLSGLIGSVDPGFPQAQPLLQIPFSIGRREGSGHDRHPA